VWQSGHEKGVEEVGGLGLVFLPIGTNDGMVGNVEVISMFEVVKPTN
jgi:hypothetical protein